MSSSPQKKRKKTTTTKTNEPSLPDDLLLSCFARVSRLHYKSISLTSKRCHSLITSKMIYQIRNSLGNTESCLYVCLRFPPDPSPHWFTLYRKPDKPLTEDTTLKKKTKKKMISSGHLLIPIPSLNSLPVPGSSLVAVGSDIYNIGGGFLFGRQLSNVSILDCQTHKWREAPNMRMGRNVPATCVIDGKIYVAGGCGNPDRLNSIEVFDTKTQIWSPLHGPTNLYFNWRFVSIGACIDGKLHLMNGSDGLAYDPKEFRWDRAAYELRQCLDFHCHCAIENVYYWYYEGLFKWYDTKRGSWKKMKGLVGLPKISSFAHVKMVDYGGKMAVLWDKNVVSTKKKKIWCAVIALEKSNNEKEIWGIVEWCEAVLTVPKSYKFEYALAASV